MQKGENMKIYLSGPMTGIVNANASLFDRAKFRLVEEGNTVFSPVDNDRARGMVFNFDRPVLLSDLPRGVTINILLADDLRWICRYAEAIALLPGWEKSKGALAEKYTGEALGLTIMVLGKRFTDV
jgi:Domain of unknown function (DUF4406)